MERHYETVSQFATLIDEHTRNFVGREFVFQEIGKFIAENLRGDFIIKGEPGIGKTALMAHLVKTRNYIHHINITAQGIRHPAQFLNSVCPQLITKYRLTQFDFASSDKESGSFLNKILQAISDHLNQTNGKEIIIVDALDEAKRPSPGENLLFLPKILPPHIYISISCCLPVHLILLCTQIWMKCSIIRLKLKVKPICSMFGDICNKN